MRARWMGKVAHVAVPAILAVTAATGLAPSAEALPAGALAFEGQGALSPGYTTVPREQDWVFSTILAVGASTAPGAVSESCTFVAHTDPGTVAADTATGSFNCVGSVGYVFCTFNWTRVGTVVVFTGPCQGGGTVAGAFTFVFTSLQPAVSYVLLGALAYT